MGGQSPARPRQRLFLRLRPGCRLNTPVNHSGVLLSPPGSPMPPPPDSLQRPGQPRGRGQHGVDQKDSTSAITPGLEPSFAPEIRLI